VVRLEDQQLGVPEVLGDLVVLVVLVVLDAKGALDE
jgi:hypothetical protein